MLLLFFLAYTILAQEKRAWNFGISHGVGAANAFLLPALEVDYHRNTFSLGLSRNTWTFGYTRELLYVGKHKNFAWVATGAFVADFLPKVSFTERVTTLHYFDRPKTNNGDILIIACTGLRAQFLKRCYASFQLGAGMRHYLETNVNPYFAPTGQIGVGIRLFKIKEE